MTLVARHRAAAATVALVLTLGLAACSSSGSAEEGYADASVGTSEQVTTDEAAGSVAPADATDTTVVVDREVIVTAWVELVAEDPAATVDEIVRMVEQAGGHVESLTESPATDDRPGQGALTVRVPADRTTSTIEALSDVAETRGVELSQEDVTSQGQDLDARISALTTSTERLTELLATASTTSALLEVERELAARQSELDSLTAQREALSDQVALSTLHVTVTADSAPVTAPRSGFLDGLATGWSALVATLRTAVLVIGVALPWLLLGGTSWAVWRLVRRRRRTAPPAGPGPQDRSDDGDDDGPAPGTPSQGPEREPVLTS